MTGREIIAKWTGETAMDLVSNYQRLGLKASGQWSRDLETRIEEKGTKYTITFLGSKYTEQLILGRRPNKNQNKEAIRKFVGWAGSTFLADWVKNKGLKISPFAVAYKIAREGIQVPNANNPGTILSNVFSEDRINELLKTLSMSIVTEVRSDIKKVFA